MGDDTNIDPGGPAGSTSYGLRPGAEQFPLMVVISVIYPCNLGCPNCPYTDGNSQIRRFYRERHGELIDESLWRKIAEECGAYGAWLRCTGGGEPMLHPRMVEMVEFAKERGARVWLNTNGSVFGPLPRQRRKLERLLAAEIDLIEFSMDAADAQTYAQVRPPRSGRPRDAERWWSEHLENVRSALEIRARTRARSRIVVSLIRQDALAGRIEEAVDFWLRGVGVDDVITRKFLTWDDNTALDSNHALDLHLYRDLPTEPKAPCVWPFERLNVDTLGRVALCGQDIAFRTAGLFPNVRESSIQEIWQGEAFNRYRRLHLEGRGAEAWPCRGCSAWYAGIRDWQHGWLKVLRTSGSRLEEALRHDVGAEVEIHRVSDPSSSVSGP